MRASKQVREVWASFGLAQGVASDERLLACLCMLLVSMQPHRSWYLGMHAGIAPLPYVHIITKRNGKQNTAKAFYSNEQQRETEYPLTHQDPNLYTSSWSYVLSHVFNGLCTKVHTLEEVDLSGRRPLYS